jgi:hypothetical protein
VLKQAASRAMAESTTIQKSSKCHLNNRLIIISAKYDIISARRREAAALGDGR